MATKAELQAAYKSAIEKGKELASKLDFTAEDETQLESIKAQAARLAKQIDHLAALEMPDGQSAVKTGWSGRESLPGEGAIKGVAADPYSGEMYAIDEDGETKLEALKSGAYKMAVNSYVRNAGLHKDDWRRFMKADHMKILNEGLDTSGGFWVPPDFRPDLVKKMATMTTIRQNASVFTTGADLLRFPKVNYTTDDLYTSGVRFGWGSALLAADTSEATNPTAGQVNIPVHLAIAAIILTRSQLEDNSFDLMGYVSNIMAEAFGLGLEDAYINGTGAGQPEGLLSNANIATAASSGGMYVPSGTSAKFDWGTVSAASSALPTKGLVGTEAALPPQYESGAAWYGSKQAYSIVRAFTDTTGRPLWNPAEAWPTMTNGYAPTLLGYPIRKTQFMPTTFAANTQMLAFGDMKGYYIVDRVGLSIEVLRELRALRDEVVVVARQRTGGQLVHDWKMKTLKLSAS